MKLLIAGAESPTGHELLELLTQQGVGFELIPEAVLAANDQAALDQLVTAGQPGQLLNLHTFGPSSQRAIYAAEEEVERCTRVQRDHTLLLAALCERHNLPMLQLSTCYVFDGEKRLGYNEQDGTGPLSTYGSSALQGERAVQQLARHVILRIGWAFGRRQYDVIESWLAACKQQEGRLELLQRRLSPTPTEDVARVILAVCRQVDCDASVWGIYHYCGLETKTELEFVQQVLKYASKHDEQIYQLLENFTMTEVPPQKPEIVNSTLSAKKIFDTFGIKQRSWHGSLQAAIRKVYQGRSRTDGSSAAERPAKSADLSKAASGLH